MANQKPDEGREDYKIDQRTKVQWKKITGEKPLCDNVPIIKLKIRMVEQYKSLPKTGRITCFCKANESFHSSNPFQGPNSE